MRILSNSSRKLRTTATIVATTVLLLAGCSSDPSPARLAASPPPTATLNTAVAETSPPTTVPQTANNQPDTTTAQPDSYPTPPATQQSNQEKSRAVRGNPNTPGACSAGNIRPTISSTSHTAGGLIVTIVMRNTGPSCAMYGYPGVSFVDHLGTQIGQAAAREQGSPRQQVPLPTGAEATFSLRISNALITDPAVCQPNDQVQFLKVYPPGAFDAFTIPYIAAGCDNPAVNLMQTTAVTPR
ncbi:DUF4232 domain-containing protein [Corynebacterium choanae]|uniref:DUF4232 domain-containing protein n=1 Tax=Corynebacterium choanae TaxID=1862358 RepID=A0A3G6JB14_9CORY|nr:DUF4232 domain-containing protein [Corynebacterium choanae]AZA13194.1 hypothetical protein CCHOA_03925 [Corynebacterium choanae]